MCGAEIYTCKYRTNRGKTDWELSNNLKKLAKKNLSEPELEPETSGLLYSYPEVSNPSPSSVKVSLPVFQNAKKKIKKLKKIKKNNRF
jgi:hypothetical protein